MRKFIFLFIAFIGLASMTGCLAEEIVEANIIEETPQVQELQEVEQEVESEIIEQPTARDILKIKETHKVYEAEATNTTVFPYDIGHPCHPTICDDSVYDYRVFTQGKSQHILFMEIYNSGFERYYTEIFEICENYIEFTYYYIDDEIVGISDGRRNECEENEDEGGALLFFNNDMNLAINWYQNVYFSFYDDVHFTILEDRGEFEIEIGLLNVVR